MLHYSKQGDIRTGFFVLFVLFFPKGTLTENPGSQSPYSDFENHLIFYFLVSPFESVPPKEKKKNYLKQYFAKSVN